VPLDFVNLGNGSEVVAASAGFQHTCVLFSGGEIGCFGANGYGQLGLGHVDNVGDDELLSTVGVLELPPAEGLSVGFHHSCAVFDNDEILCWGRNERGQLGQGNTVQIGDDELPNTIGAFGLGLPITELDVGGQHSCALLDQREVMCWGLGGGGRLGYGNTEDIGDDELPADAGFVELL
jgi:alpha-tubulin suppressor-like RCC1 family protein